jgi:hypothetical protein
MLEVNSNRTNRAGGSFEETREANTEHYYKGAYSLYCGCTIKIFAAEKEKITDK